MDKAKRFQPLAVLNQKFKNLDVFESNEVIQMPSRQANTSSPEPAQLDPDEVIKRDHWQRPKGNDSCSQPSCGKRLIPANGKINCRKCGRLFCDEHTLYQIKLSRSAQHEPVRGLWCRVCETCYKSREGYNDRSGKLSSNMGLYRAYSNAMQASSEITQSFLINLDGKRSTKPCWRPHA